jgi:hypothetical protein
MHREETAIAKHFIGIRVRGTHGLAARAKSPRDVHGWRHLAEVQTSGTLHSSAKSKSASQTVRPEESTHSTAHAFGPSTATMVPRVAGLRSAARPFSSRDVSSLG